MVQFFKKLFAKNDAQYRTLEYNRAKLQSEINALSDKLYDFRREVSWQIVREVIELAKNIQILEVNRYGDEKSLAMHRGRLQALSDLSAYIDAAIIGRSAEAKDGKAQVRNTIRQPKRGTINQAHAAM